MHRSIFCRGLISTMGVACFFTSACSDQKTKNQSAESDEHSAHIESKKTTSDGSDLDTARKTFHKGDTMEFVRSIVGPPESETIKHETQVVWHYKFSSIVFSNGVVVSWSDLSAVLPTEGSGAAIASTQGALYEYPSAEGPSSSQAGANSTGSGAAGNDVTVHGYTRKDGTVVQSYHRTKPDGDKSNNYSSSGNTNPHTGKRGSKKN